MFDEIEELLRETELEVGILNENLQGVVVNREAQIEEERIEQVKLKGLKDFKKVVQPSSQQFSFPKQKRFKTKKMKDKRDFLGSETYKKVNSKKPKLGKISQTKRFREPKKPAYNPNLKLKPNYEVKFKKVQGFKMKAKNEAKREIRRRLKEKEMKMHRETITSKKALENLSMITADTENSILDCSRDKKDLPGPGAYDPVIMDDFLGSKNPTFPKSERFRQQKKDKKNKLKINYKQVDKKVKGVKIARNEKVTKKLKLKRVREKELEDRRAKAEINRMREKERRRRAFLSKKKEKSIAEKQAFLEKNGAPRQPGTVAKQGMSKKERLMEVFRILDELEKMRLGPGTYNPEKKKTRDDTCLVDYGKKYIERFVDPIKDPIEAAKLGPGHYLSKDDMIRPKAPTFKIVLPEKKSLTASEILAQFDQRDYLDTDYDPIKKRTVLGVINPETDQEPRIDPDELKMGPGTYDPEYKLTEKRVDVLGAKYPDLTMYNSRLARIEEMAPNNDTEFKYDPKTTLTKPRVKTTKIAEEVKIEPPNIPDRDIYPEEWRFYNRDVTAVKPSTQTLGKFVSEPFGDFKLKAQEKEMLSEYLAMQNRMPDPGFYDPLFTLLEEGVPVPSFGRYLERSDILTKSELMNMEIDGDNLVLNPSQVKPRGGNLVQMDKMTGRDGGDVEEAGIDLLDSEVFLDKITKWVDKRVTGYVDLGRQAGRGEAVPGGGGDDLGEGLVLDVDYGQVDPKVNNVSVFGRQERRLERPDRDEGLVGGIGEEEIVPNVNYDFGRKRVGTLVVMKGPVKKGRDKYGNSVRGGADDDDD